MTISQRLYLLVGTALMSLLVLTAINHVQMNDVYEETNFSNINVVPSIEILNKVIVEFGRLRVRVYRHALANPEEKAEIEKTMIDSQTLIDRELKRYEAFVTNAEGRINS